MVVAPIEFNSVYCVLLKPMETGAQEGILVERIWDVFYRNMLLELKMRSLL